MPASFDSVNCIAYRPDETNSYYDPPWTFVRNDYLKLPFTANYEEITPNDEGSRKRWKSFEHYRLECLPTTMSRSVTLHKTDFGPEVAYIADHNDPFYGVPSNSDYGPLGKFNNGLPAFYTKRVDYGFVPQPTDLDALIQNALSTMVPDIKAKLSLINSTIELKDFVSLPNSLKNINTLLSKNGIIKTATGAFKTLKQILKELVRTSSDSYLQLKFNIQPLLSDINALYASMILLEKRMNDLVAREGRVQMRHYSRIGIEYPDILSDEQNLGSTTGSNPWIGWHYNWSTIADRQVHYSPTVFHAQMKYNYNFTSYQREHARVLLLLDHFGVNLNPQIIWNAIPWSFVVDWVFGISRWLGQFKTANMEPQINIIDFLWSVKRSRRISFSTKVGNAIQGYSFPTPTKKLVCVTSETSYRRSVGYPSTSSLNMSGLSSTEFSLGAALVLSRRRR